jgi:hypothetical protein
MHNRAVYMMKDVSCRDVWVMITSKCLFPFSLNLVCSTMSEKPELSCKHLQVITWV